MKQPKADFLRNSQRMLDYLRSLNTEPIIATTRTMKKVLFEKRKLVKIQYKYQKYKPSRESVRAILKYLHDTGAIDWNRHHKVFPKITIKKL